MFNDDVPAKCPECSSIDVEFDREQIWCKSCDAKDVFKLNGSMPIDDALAEINKQHAISVFRRWGFAG